MGATRGTRASLSWCGRVAQHTASALGNNACWYSRRWNVWCRIALRAVNSARLSLGEYRALGRKNWGISPAQIWERKQHSTGNKGADLRWELTAVTWGKVSARSRAAERSGARDLWDRMNCWAGGGQMERDLGGGPKFALFSTFGRVIALLITHMFWEWARGGLNRIRITIST